MKNKNQDMKIFKRKNKKNKRINSISKDILRNSLLAIN